MHIVKTQTDKLIVGTNDVSYFAPDQSPTGTAVLNGPVYIGEPTMSLLAGGYEAALNVASNGAAQNPLDTQPAYESSLAIKSDGNVVITGDNKTSKALKVRGDTETIGDAHVTGNVSTGGDLTVGGHASWSSSIVATTKLFDIEHPSKENHRLRHACLEGSEHSVYYRGRLKGKNIIELPYYWKDLVYEDSITVQLQSIGKHQNLVIESFNNEYVVIEIGANQDFLTGEILIDCFYHVYAERKDVDKLEVEYKGEKRKQGQSQVDK